VDENFKSSHSNIIFFDATTSGTLRINTLYIESATLKVYKITDNSTEYIKTLKLGTIDSVYLISGNDYIIEANFNNSNPNLSVEFFPDGSNISDGQCIPLDDSLPIGDCDKFWLQAYYDKEIQPLIDEKKNKIRYRVGNVGKEKALNDAAYAYADSMIDMVQFMRANSYEDEAKIAAKKLGQWVAGDMPRDVDIGGVQFDAGFAFDTFVQHALLWDDVFTIVTTGGTPDNWINVTQQLSADLNSIYNSTSGILELNDLKEKYNETVIVERMLKYYVHDNFGDWDALVTYSGTTVSSPNIDDIIRGVADKYGFEDWVVVEEYEVERAREEFYNILDNTGDWVYSRKKTKNPYNDVDLDGVSNQNEIINGTDPNNATTYDFDSSELIDFNDKNLVHFAIGSLPISTDKVKELKINFGDGNNKIFSSEEIESGIISTSHSYQTLSSDKTYNIEYILTTQSNTLIKDNSLVIIKGDVGGSEEPVNSTLYAYDYKDIESTGDIDVNSGVKFCVKGYTQVSQLDKVEWYLNESLYNTDNFENDEINSGTECEYIKFTQVAQDQKVVARVYREDGVSKDVKWSRDVESSDIPSLIRKSPSEQDAVFPIAQEVDFEVDVSDSDDDTKTLYWYIDDKLVETDKVGGGNPVGSEHFDYQFNEKGNYVVKAKAIDEKGNFVEMDWTITIGTSTPGNDAPFGEIKYPSEFNTQTKLRAGYYYDFQYYCTDFDGNLAYSEVKIDDSTEWSKRYTNGHYDELEGNLDEPRERVSIDDLIFTTTGEHTISLLCRDGDGIESLTTLDVNISESDDGSLDNAPQFAKIFPSNDKTYHLKNDGYSGTEAKIYFTAYDKDGDLDDIEVYINGLYEDSKSVSKAIDADYISVDFDDKSTGNYTFKLKLIDEQGNYTFSDTYSVSVGSNNGNNKPEIVKTYPNFLATSQSYKIKSGNQFCASINVIDVDGDLDDAYWFSTVGSITNDGTWSDGRIYDKKSLDSSFRLDVDKCFDVTQDGYVGIIVQDDKENKSSEYRWKVELVENVENNKPTIEWSTIQDNQHYQLIANKDFIIPFEAKDVDGDIKSIQLWLENKLVQEVNLTGTQFQTYQFVHDDANDIETSEPNIYDPDRTPTLPFVFKVIDSKNNEANISGTVAWGIYNHNSNYPLEIQQLNGYEDFPIKFVTQFSDEDGDSHTCNVKRDALYGSLDFDGSSIQYVPNDDYFGNDNFSLNCSDGYGSVGTVEYNQKDFPDACIGWSQV
jgi:hypothetical protein